MKACYSCGAQWTEQEAPGFSVTCEKCGEFLHCCRNCRFYAPGQHNDCREPQADPVRDKDTRNLCEWFQFADRDARGEGDDRASAAKAKLEALFGPAEPPGEPAGDERAGASQE
jgi:hypothetical protein